MNVYNLLVFCFVLLLSDKALSNINVPLKENDDVVQQSFARLLKTIVKVNEERMQALEKITQLQDYMLTKNKLKTDEDSMAESMEEEDNRIVLAYADMPLLRRTEDETIKRAMCNQFNIERNSIDLWTKQFLKLACNSHRRSLCVNSCKQSVLKLCKKFHCNHNNKRDLITECREKCKFV